MKKWRGSFLPWLIVLNTLALAYFGAKYLYLANKEKQEQHKQVLTAAGISVRMGNMDVADATKWAEITTDIEHGASISDADLDWCLGELKSQEPSAKSALYRREDVDITLSEAVKVLDAPQKEKLFQAMTVQFASDNPREEIGVDVKFPARILGQLGDKRAIPILKPHLNDPRPTVNREVQGALNSLEGKATK